MPVANSTARPIYFKLDSAGGAIERVGVVSDVGLFTLLDATTGEVLHPYAVTPSSFVHTPSTPSADGGAWFAAGMDGVVARAALA